MRVLRKRPVLRQSFGQRIGNILSMFGCPSLTVPISSDPGWHSFYTPGIYTWTSPTGISSLTVKSWGVGGTGGDGDSGQGGGGGAGCGYSEKTVTGSVGGQTFTVYVGSGSNRWTTQVVCAALGINISITAAGNGRGATEWNGTKYGAGGIGVLPTGGDINYAGTNGEDGDTSGNGGNGGEGASETGSTGGGFGGSKNLSGGAFAATAGGFPGGGGGGGGDSAHSAGALGGDALVNVYYS